MVYFSYLYFLLTSIIHTQVYFVHLGQNTNVQIFKQSTPGKTFIHLHENERTALYAAKLYVDTKGGTLITIKHSGQRNIVFYMDNQRFEFDPNRIFTDDGIKKTLLEYGSYTPAAHLEVKKLAEEIKSLLPAGKIIAVHNNRDYSIREYFPQHPLYNEAKALNYLSQSNYRNFFFVTSMDEFKRLKNLAFNVALQSDIATDDGSLSYFLGKSNYINVEAGYDQLAAQFKMLGSA